MARLVGRRVLPPRRRHAICTDGHAPPSRSHVPQIPADSSRRRPMKGLRRPQITPPWQEILANERESWYPLCYERSNAEHLQALERLIGSGEVVHVYDTIEAQLADLVRTRAPSFNPTPQESAERVQAHLNGTS